MNRIIGFVGAIAFFVLGACSNDTLENKNKQNVLNTGDTSGGVYMAVDFLMPNGASGTRSETQDPDDENNPNHFQSSDGEEIGSDSENYVGSALIVIAASEDKVAGSGSDKVSIKKYGFIVAGEVPSNRIASSTTNDGNKQYKAIARLQKENLNTFYLAYGEEQKIPEVYVFIFSNPTAELLSMFTGETPFGSDSWINQVCEVKQGHDETQNKNIGIWGSNSFLMNNVRLEKRELPKKLLDWEYYSSIEKPFHLSAANTGCDENVDNSGEGRGTIWIQRSVARFDFMDGSNNDNTYTALYNMNSQGDVDTGQPLVNIQLQKMCLVNMCNKFYYVPRVSPNGYEADASFCYKELPWIKGADGIYTGGNYVVGPYASVFGGAKTLTTDFSSYFNYPFFEDNGSFNNEEMSADRWDVVKVDDVLKGSKDNYKGTDGNLTPGQYHIWRYVTENVIPGGPLEQPSDPSNQVNGISTGVVFKAKLKGGYKEENSYYEEAWEKGVIKNLAFCLDGKSFTYNGIAVDKIKGNSKDDPILYYYNGRLYMGWRHMRQSAIQASVTINAVGHIEINRSNSIYKAVFGDGPIPPVFKMEDNQLKPSTQYYIDADGNYIEFKDPLWNESWPLQPSPNQNLGETYDNYLESANYAWSVWAKDGKELVEVVDGKEKPSEELKAMREAVTGAGITIYQSSVDSDYGPGYYCYYYYWNRHNDNGLNGSMGPMEFAVVRNNIYKLSVNRISRLGHPRIPENDPDNPTPSSPDESDEIYLDVSIKIAPWVVRVNGAVF